MGQVYARLTVHRFSPDNLRAAWWALGAVRRTRRRLGDGGLDAALAPPAPPQLQDEAVRAVRAVLRRSDASCLVRSIVMQRWLAAQGDARDLIVGVTGPGAGFEAHAWLDGEAPHGGEAFHELLRRPA
jgi:hypothetical protein